MTLRRTLATFLELHIPYGALRAACMAACSVVARLFSKTTSGIHHLHPMAAQGYYFTGDGCRRDGAGMITITGRVDDVINVSGHRVGTAEVEAALASHGACIEAAVVGCALPPCCRTSCCLRRAAPPHALRALQCTAQLCHLHACRAQPGLHRQAVEGSRHKGMQHEQYGTLYLFAGGLRVCMLRFAGARMTSRARHRCICGAARRRGLQRGRAQGPGQDCARADRRLCRARRHTLDPRWNPGRHQHAVREPIDAADKFASPWVCRMWLLNCAQFRSSKFRAAKGPLWPRRAPQHEKCD